MSTQSVATGGSSVWSTSGTSAYYTAGSVGIGTSSPAATLDVNGSMNVSGNFFSPYMMRLLGVAKTSGNYVVPNGNSYTAVQGLTVTVTPTRPTSSLYVVANVGVMNNMSTSGLWLTFYQNGVLAGNPDTLGPQNENGYQEGIWCGKISMMETLAGGSTPQTIAVYAMNTTGGPYTVSIAGRSDITVFEVLE